jgi:hypothetical protein
MKQLACSVPPKRRLIFKGLPEDRSISQMIKLFIYTAVRTLDPYFSMLFSYLYNLSLVGVWVYFVKVSFFVFGWRLF